LKNSALRLVSPTTEKRTVTTPLRLIEDISYPRDLRFRKVVTFKEQLAAKVLGTYQASESDPTHSTFLKNFGKFQIAKLDQEEVTSEKWIVDKFTDIHSAIDSLRRAVSTVPSSSLPSWTGSPATSRSCPP
jgi:hypothetical protein